VPAISTISHEEGDEYVSQIANAHLSELLQNDTYTSYASDWPSLDDELGETFVWDKTFEDEGDEFLEPPERTKYVRPRQAQKRSAHEMLLKFDPQCPPQSDNLEDMELWLECEAQRESALKYQNIIDSARERKDFASLSMVQKQILHWYPTLKDAIEIEQQAYLTKSSESKKDRNRYGPFLCTLPPQKLAVIVAHECIMHILTKGANGVTLVSTALRIGNAMEAEVNVQRVLQEQAEESRRRNKGLIDEDVHAHFVDADNLHSASLSTDLEPDQESEDPKKTLNDWMYGASHLQRFLDKAHQSDPSKKTRIRISYANRRARRLLNNAEEWRKTDKLKVGVALIELLLENAMVDQSAKPQAAFSYEKVYHSQDKFVGRLYLHDKIYNMAVEDSRAFLGASTTRHKPMIVPPRDWVAPDDGGYSWLKVDLMRTHGSKLQKVGALST
jgi:DNA-directed RNA polymerase